MKHRALFLAVLVGATTAFAQGAPIGPGGPGAQVTQTPSSSAPVTPSGPMLPAPEKRLGLSLDVAFPDFLGLNAVFRPVHFLRFHGGPLYNGSGFGLRGGISLIPFNFFITPALTAEYGRYFQSDGASLLERFQVDLGAFEPLVRELSYDYINGQLGLEIGHPQAVMFYLRAGLTFLSSTLAGSQETLQNLTNDPTLTVDDFRIQGAFPAVKFGFVIYLG